MVQESWSKEGEFVYCKHDDCHYYIRNHGKKKRLLAKFYPDRVEFKCDSCGEKSSFKFVKDSDKKTVVDEKQWKPLKSMLEEWDRGKTL